MISRGCIQHFWLAPELCRLRTIQRRHVNIMFSVRNYCDPTARAMHPADVPAAYSRGLAPIAGCLGLRMASGPIMRPLHGVGVTSHCYPTPMEQYLRQRQLPTDCVEKVGARPIRGAKSRKSFIKDADFCRTNGPTSKLAEGCSGIVGGLDDPRSFSTQSAYQSGCSLRSTPRSVV